MSPLPTYSPSAKGDDEEAYQRASLDRGKTPEIVRAAPQDDSRTAGYMGEKAPTETDGAGRVLFDPQPDSIPETCTAPESGKRPFPKGGACYQCPLSNQRRRIIYWKRCKAPPSWMRTVPIWVRWLKRFGPSKTG